MVKVRVVKGAEATRMPDSPAVRMHLGSHNHGEQKPKRDAKNSLHHYALLQELSNTQHPRPDIQDRHAAEPVLYYDYFFLCVKIETEWRSATLGYWSPIRERYE